MFDPTEVSPETRLAHVLERETCGRCGGSGRYSFNPRDGDRCWGCGGKGTRLTKRGSAALALYRRLTTTEARWIRVGDRVRTAHGWATVEAIGDNRVERKSGRVLELDDPALAEARRRGASVSDYSGGKAVVYEGVNVRTGKVTFCGCGPDQDFQVGLSGEPEVSLAVLRTVAEFQADLVKRGTPRKGSRFAEVS